MSGRKKLVFRLLSLSSYIFVLRYNSALFLTNVENIIRNSLHPPVDIFRSTHVQSTDLCFPYDDSVLYSVAQRCYSVVLTCSFCSLLCAHFVSVYKCWFDTHKAEECVCCRLPCARVSFCVLSWYLWQLFFFPSRCSESVVHSFPFAHCRISSSQKSLERQHTHESVSMNNDIRWWQFRSSHVKIGITLLYERKGFIFPFNWFELSELNNGCVRSLNSKAFNISYNKCASAIKMHLKCDSSCELTLEPLSNRPTLKLISSIYPFQITAEKKNSRISWIAV